MGLDAILECENRLQARQNSTGVHSSCHISSKVDEERGEEKPTSRSCLLNSLDDDFGELSISPCRKSMPCRPVGVKVENNDVLKRGSVYQSSREVRKLKKLREGRRKIEAALSDESFLTFEIVNPVSQFCQNEAISSDLKRRTPLNSLNADQNYSSFGNAQAVLTNTSASLDLSFRLLPEEQLNLNTQCFDPRRSSSDSYLEICLLPDNTEFSRDEVVQETVESCSLKESKFRSSETLGPENDGHVHSERDIAYTLSKSSAKVGTCKTLCQPESDLPKASQRARFSPIRKMLDPIKKSKSQRNPSLSKTAACNRMSPDSSSIRREKSFHNSLLSDLSRTEQKADHHDRLIDRDQWTVNEPSPAHLHGFLKLECKQGMPSFEFSVKDPDDVLSAKTWKTHNAFNWVYTFHSGKKNGGSGWGSKDRHRQSLPMVGQMQVSCYFCSELSSNGPLDNSAVTEFILYDISHAKRSSFGYEERYPFPEFVQPPRGTISESLSVGDSLDSNDSSLPKNCSSSRVTNGDHSFETSASCLWAPIDLLPHLEVAAIVIQIPFGAKRTLKDRLRDDTRNKQYTDLPGISVSDHGRDATSANPHAVNVKVVTSSGKHGFPSTEEGGPSPLLDRWRSGGECDCGGWDMACPITILDNGEEDTTNISGSHLSLELFVQGTKDKKPALTIKTCDDGQYSVDFHAQFSKLQAFSISVSVLHSLEAFGIVSQEKNGQRLHSNSLKLLLEEEVRQLIEAVAKEDQRKVNRKVQQIPAPYLVDPPPFSPMGRV
uniref:Bifunctional protein GlmU n=1 Tax=Anthurium amnicola TaxID=1678845 RepID=A0A1D1XE48_9ARAE